MVVGCVGLSAHRGGGLCRVNHLFMTTCKGFAAGLGMAVGMGLLFIPSGSLIQAPGLLGLRPAPIFFTLVAKAAI